MESGTDGGLEKIVVNVDGIKFSIVLSEQELVNLGYDHDRRDSKLNQAIAKKLQEIDTQRGTEYFNFYMRGGFYKMNPIVLPQRQRLH